MGPKKEKNISIKRDNVGRESTLNFDSPINSDSWKCVILMAVEKSLQDKFLLKEFEEEAKSQKRPKVQVISYSGILKLINDILKGEIHYKFAFFQSFLSVFEEAGEYLSKKREIPINLQVKLIKTMLLYFKEEYLIKLDKEPPGPVDHIKAMADRPATLGPVEIKKKDSVKKADNGFKVRPPSYTKAETGLLKRGEGTKVENCIIDAPVDGYFNFYVLLIEFYSPELPIELINANIPLHGLLCIDTSLSVKDPALALTQFKSSYRSVDLKEDPIQEFWRVFLQYLWGRATSCHFRDFISQVYTPEKLHCDKKKRQEFIYRELSYLLYDMSGYKQQLDNYMSNMRLWDVEEVQQSETGLHIEDMPNECVTVPVVLQSLMDAICGNDDLPETRSSESFSDAVRSFESVNESEDARMISLSLVPKFGSLIHPNFSVELLNRGDQYSMNVYMKTKALDILYNMDDVPAAEDVSTSETSQRQTLCRYDYRNCSPNLEEIFRASGSKLRAIRGKYKFKVDVPHLDYILYSILMTRVFCSYQTPIPQPTLPSSSSIKKSDFKLIENLDTEMTKPQFTVTDGSRHVLKSIPYNVKDFSKDFFRPSWYKIVTPAKVKASSAPTCRVLPPLKVQRSFMSDLLPGLNEFPQNKDLLFDLKELLGGDSTACTNDFNYLEILNKKKLSDTEFELLGTFNCIDHTYSLIHDAVFVAMHTRTNGEDSQHETFNTILRTDVGLRDFFDYVLEDDGEWFKSQQKTSTLNSLSGKSLQENRLEFSDSTFWMADSIKYQFWKRDTVKSENAEDSPSNQNTSDKLINKEATSEEPNDEKEYFFEGFNMSEAIVQFSGLKTVFYSDDCSVTVELIERLYGEQVLGVHISQTENTLHLYSYACPEPHIDEPFTFHVTYKNGIILAFGRYEPEMCDEPIVSSSTTVGNKKGILGTSERKKMCVTLTEEFHFVMAASLPNGLTIRTVRGMKPCYIRQKFLSHSDETSRLFLPNGNVIKMMNDGKIEIFKTDTSIISAELKEFVDNYRKYKIVDGSGDIRVVENGQVTSSTGCHVFRNSDLESDRVYFRRHDGTDYMLQGDGTLYVKFHDGTKMCSCPFAEPLRPEYTEGKLLGGEYIIVYLIITVEHPDYVTTMFNTKTQKWKLRLPYDSTITVHPKGEYCVSIDRQSELIVQDNWLEALRFSPTDELRFHAVVDLSVFHRGKSAYVYAKDSTGKKFTVEANSNCYVEKCPQSETASAVNVTQSTQIACTSLCGRANPLTDEKKYFVINKDMSGFELLQEKGIVKALCESNRDAVVFTQHLPGLDLRCFVIIIPSEKSSLKEWEVDSILPDPTYVPRVRAKVFRSTYGKPPSWMHPFPKKKEKFQIPDYFTSRVFMEIKPTEFTPWPNVLECRFCEVEEVEPKFTLLKDTKAEDYLRKLSNNNQDILREMYTIIAAGIINKPILRNRTPSEELEHYLVLSNYYVELQEYHKYCIRNHSVPKYFRHPVGKTWLILNDLIGGLKLRDSETTKAGGDALKTSLSSAQSPYSSSDVEYNLSIKTCQSFSSLSYHSSRTGQTAPDIIETQGMRKCKVKPERRTESDPVLNYNWDEKSKQSKSGLSLQPESELETTELSPKICDFSGSDFDLFDTMDFVRNEKGSRLTLEDLMCLNLV